MADQASSDGPSSWGPSVTQIEFYGGPHDGDVWPNAELRPVIDRWHQAGSDRIRSTYRPCTCGECAFYLYYPKEDLRMPKEDLRMEDGE